MKKFLLIIAAASVGFLPQVAFCLNVPKGMLPDGFEYGALAANLNLQKDGNPNFDIQEAQAGQIRHGIVGVNISYDAEDLMCGRVKFVFSDGTKAIVDPSVSPEEAYASVAR